MVGGGSVVVADNAVGVGGTVVGATVGGEFVGVVGSAVGVGGGVDAQATMKTVTRMSTII